MRGKPAEYSATQGMRQLPGTFCMDLNAQEGRKMNFTPQLSEVRAIAAEKKYAVVPISCEILSDICTPILTDLVDAVLVGDELALDVLTLQRAAQQGGYPADRADRLPDSCWHAGKRRSSAILADSYADLLYLSLLLCKRIFCGIRQALGLVVGNVRNAEELEHFKQRLAIVTEGNGAVVRVALLNQDMAVETAHLGNGEDGDAAERPRCNG